VFVQHSVVASTGDREGTPVAVLEAGAAGLPVVATRHEGIADVVVDGETGLLVEEGDVDGMGDALVELLTDPERARRIGRAARERVELLFSLESTTERLCSILEQACAGSRVSSEQPLRATSTAR
jgi:glycosyltransferase involved in cell wall biosynthesis